MLYFVWSTYAACACAAGMKPPFLSGKFASARRKKIDVLRLGLGSGTLTVVHGGNSEPNNLRPLAKYHTLSHPELLVF